METLLPGISSRRVPTDRLTTAVLEVTGRAGPPVLFVHGNVMNLHMWDPLVHIVESQFSLCRLGFAPPRCHR